MHAIIDTNHHRPSIPEIGYPYPGIEFIEIAGGGEFAMRVDLTGRRERTVEALAVKAGNAIERVLVLLQRGAVLLGGSPRKLPG
jgi:hypothetical protein